MKPLWTDSSIEMMERHVKGDMTVFEWGSGASTVWFAERVAKLYSIEHSLLWYEKVASWLESSGLVSKTVLLHADITSGDYLVPMLNQADEKFNLVLVDGAFRRIEVMERSIPKVKIGGLIVLDDSQNLSYLGAFHLPRVKVLEESEPDLTGKKMTIFERIE